MSLDAQRAPAGANNSLIISAPVTTNNQPGTNNLGFSAVFTTIDEPGVVARYDPRLFSGATSFAPVPSGAMSYLEWLQIEYDAEMARLTGGAEMDWY